MSKTCAGRPGAGKRGGRRSTSWRKGQSGNPAGRKPDLELAEVRKAGHEMFGPHADEAKGVVLEIMRKGKSEHARLSAAEVVIERVFGKAPAEVKLDLPEQWSTADLLEALPKALEALGARGGK